MKLKERGLTLADIFTVLKKSFICLIACAVIGAGAGWLFASTRVSETFTATSTVYVQTITADMDSGVGANDTALARAMAANCREVMLNNKLAENVRRYFAERRVDSPDENWEDISGYSDTAILSMITVSVEASSQNVVISVTAPTASLACHLANAVAGETEVSVVDIIGNCLVIPTIAATSATRFRVDSRRSMALIGAAGLVCVSYAVFLAIHFLDKRVRSAKEAEEDFGEFLPCLGTLPKEKER